MPESKINDKFQTRCFRVVDGSLKTDCLWVKNGKTKYGKQRYLCRACQRSKVDDPKTTGFGVKYNDQIIQLTKEGMGIRSTARILNVSPATVIRKILGIAEAIELTEVPSKLDRIQVDEIHTFIGSKTNSVYIIYSWDQELKRALSLTVGTRSKANLRSVVNPLLSSEIESINTDRYSGYKGVVPKKLHTTFKRRNNGIERQNLNLRIHLKRLNRKTICFSKSREMLEAVLKIYFWYKSSKNRI
jgi:IS1 family transposase/transposase-like protein